MLPSVRGMIRRNPSMIIKDIVRKLSDKPLSLRALETKIDTNDKTIKEYTSLLCDLNILKLKKINKGRKVITKKITPKKTVTTIKTPKRTVTKTVTHKKTVTRKVTPKTKEVYEVIREKNPLI